MEKEADKMIKSCELKQHHHEYLCHVGKWRSCEAKSLYSECVRKAKSPWEQEYEKKKTKQKTEIYSITYRVDVILRWRIHCSEPDFTWIIYAVSKFHGVIRTWSCVRGVCLCMEACSRLARISCHIRWVPKGHLKGTGKLFTRFLRCFEVSHDLDCLDVLCRGVRVDCNVELHSNHV